MSDDFQILSPKDHVRMRPGMYVGSTTFESHQRFLFGEYKSVSYVPALVKLIDEIIDNSVDEAIRTNFEYSTVIIVEIKDNTVTVADNGRGIPQNIVKTPEGDEIPRPVAAWTRTMAGSNFSDEKRITQGMNGIGSSLVAIFSDLFIGVTCDGQNEMTVRSVNGLDHVSWSVKPGVTKGTKVTFTPDFSCFDGMMLDDTIIDIVKDRLTSLSVVFPKITFKFNGKKISGKFKSYAAMYGQDPIIVEDEHYSLALTTSPDGFRHMTFVNGLNTKVGGTHLDYVIDGLSDELISRIKKDYKVEVNKAQIKAGLTCVMVIRGLPNLRFDSQTKERLTNPLGDIKRHLDIDFKKLARVVSKCEAVIMPIIEVVLARKMAAEKAAATKAAKAAKRAKVAKHIKANLAGTDADTTLFLTEGDSAINYLIEVRDQDLHGGFPLRGKVLTTWGVPESEIVKNQEIFNIMAITGLQFGVDARETMQYKNIGILVDADLDGVGCIQPSLISFFARWPELFEDGRVRMIRTPVVIAKPKRGKSRWFYSLDEFENAREEIKGYDIRYIKGLASLTADEYHQSINNPVMDVITLPENYTEIFDMLYGDDSTLRKEWMSDKG